jgi:hypothetical protein
MSIPNHRGFALVGDADARNVVGPKPALLRGFFNYLKCSPNNLHRVVLDPARARKDLFMFPLGYRYHAAAAIEDHKASAGGSLI